MFLIPSSLGLWYPVNHCHQSDVTPSHSNHSSDGSLDIQEDHVISGSVGCGHLGRGRLASSHSTCECRRYWHYLKRRKEKGEDRLIDRQSDRQTESDRLTDRQTESDRQIESHRQTDRQTDSRTDKTDRQTDRVNKWKFVYLNCGEWYEDMTDHRSYTQLE